MSSVSDSGSNVRRLLKTALNIWLGSMGTAAPFLGQNRHEGNTA